MEEDKFIVEKRTLEELFVELRLEKGWECINIVEQLQNLGITTDEKQIKKWEIGLEYPDTDTLYKFSEMYMIPIQTLVMARTNSYNKGMASIHTMAIKWFCFLTGISMKVAYIGIYIIMGLTLIGAFMFFLDKANSIVGINSK